MKQIQTQSIKSFLVIGLGFIIGAFNTLFLFPHILSKEELGLTRLIMDVGLVLGSFATFGIIPTILKFFPFYKHHLPKETNDLPTISLGITLLGSLLLIIGVFCFREHILNQFKVNSPLFIPYYYTIIPFAIFYAFFSVFEAFAWGTGLMVFSNFLKESFVRLFTLLLLVLVFLQWITPHWFVIIFAFMYFIPAFASGISLYRIGQLPINTNTSKVTRRLGKKMLLFGGLFYTSSLLNIVAKTIDGVLLASLKNIGDMAVFSIASYFTNLLDIPQRSLTSVTVPVLADHWRNKKMDKIATMYRKSAIELLIIGVVIAGVIYLNIHNIIKFLPQGKGYEIIGMPIAILLLAKLIDLATGINNQIIGTSNFWRFDFFTNFIYTICAIPLNYFLIKNWGINGACLANLLAMTVYNTIRFVFIYKKFGLQPFNAKTLLVILFAAISILVAHKIPKFSNLFIDGLIRTPIFLFIFLGAVLLFKVSQDSQEIITKVLMFLKIKK